MILLWHQIRPVFATSGAVQHQRSPHPPPRHPKPLWGAGRFAVPALPGGLLSTDISRSDQNVQTPGPTSADMVWPTATEAVKNSAATDYHGLARIKTYNYLCRSVFIRGSVQFPHGFPAVGRGGARSGAPSGRYSAEKIPYVAPRGASKGKNDLVSQRSSAGPHDGGPDGLPKPRGPTFVSRT